MDCWAINSGGAVCALIGAGGIGGEESVENPLLEVCNKISNMSPLDCGATGGAGGGCWKFATVDVLLSFETWKVPPKSNPVVGCDVVPLENAVVGGEGAKESTVFWGPVEILFSEVALKGASPNESPWDCWKLS